MIDILNPTEGIYSVVNLFKAQLSKDKCTCLLAIKTYSFDAGVSHLF